MEFCALEQLDPDQASVNQLMRFVVFMYRDTPTKYNAARAAVSALKHYWNEQGLDFRLNQKSIITRMMKGYRENKPSDSRPTKPFSYFHMMAVRKKGIINTNTFFGKLCWGSFQVGYFYGGRIGEYSPKSRSEWKFILDRSDVEIIRDNRGWIKSIIIDFKKHKANRFGLYDAKVAVDCVCGRMDYCPIHEGIWKYIKVRDYYFGDEPGTPLLMQLNGKPISQTQIRNLMKNVARALGLNPKFYVPHSLRSGRCTDLVRARKPEWAIKKWGRWRSDCWFDHYLKMDASDIAKISSLSDDELGIQNSTILRY